MKRLSRLWRWMTGHKHRVPFGDIKIIVNHYELERRVYAIGNCACGEAVYVAYAISSAELVEVRDPEAYAKAVAGWVAIQLVGGNPRRRRVDSAGFVAWALRLGRDSK